MHPGPQSLPGFRELDHRAGAGIDVWLLWRALDDRVVVAVTDAKSGDAFTLEVAANQRAMDVFHHPYAYAVPATGAQPRHRLAIRRGDRRLEEPLWDRP
jgi:hypothetical protein